MSTYLLPSVTRIVPSLRPRFGVRDRVDGGVALTFDDGPHPAGTPAMLEALAASGARATFFLVGEQVERRPALALEIAAAGHALGVHCHRHRSLLRLTARQTRSDLERAAAAVEDAAGVRPRLYRPPYGVLNGAALDFARSHGWETLLWRREGRDWRRHATPESIAARLTRGLEPGDVLLLHDTDAYSARGSWRKTAAAVPRVLAEIERCSLRVVLP